jgi:colicin import membrane protein
LWHWVLFSGVLHLGFVLGLWAVPHMPARRTSYPVYTVDLVGGEKLGGTNLSTQPVPETKSKSSEQKPPVPVPTKQKRESKTIEKIQISAKKEKAPATKDDLVLKGAKKEKPLPEAKSAEASQVEKERLAQLNEKRIQAAVEQIRERSQPPPSSKGTVGGQPAPSNGPGEGQGAASLGPGGTGGGIVKAWEFISYRNRMLQMIKEKWTWGGKRVDLEVTVRFGIRENGEITGLRVTSASGDFSYDDAVMRAVSRSNPLPPPPENYRKDFMDVELTFRPKDLRS